MPVTRITFTGVDERTDLHHLVELSNSSRNVEWGFLYSPKQQGSPGRYPSTYFLKKTIALAPQSVQMAVHVCGRGINDILNAEPVVTNMVEMLTARSGRLQLNFNHRKRPVDLQRLAHFIVSNPGLQVITQIHDGNVGVQSGLFDILGFAPANHAMLFDASGGRGQIAATLEAPKCGIPCGYAGGIGPCNVIERVSAINAIVGGVDTWIDMESSLRTTTDDTDWFDLHKCMMTLNAVKQIV